MLKIGQFNVKDVRVGIAINMQIVFFVLVVRGGLRNNGKIEVVKGMEGKKDRRYK